MSWFGSASEWKQGLSSSALSKVEELENQVERMKRERTQKQNQLDTLQQSLDNQKRKTDEGTKEKQVLQKEIEQLARSCEQLQLQLQKGQYDHVTSSITLLPPRQPAVIDSLSSHTGEEMDSLRKKVDELLCENKDLQSKLSEQKMLHQCIDVCVTSTSAAVGDSDRDFWGNSSERSNKWSQRTPNKTPKKALETSEENPFKTPYQTLQSKGLGKSEGNLFKTPKKYHSTSSLLTIPPVPGPNDEYTKQLENMIDQYKKEIESLKSSSSSSPDTSKLQQEVTAMRTAIDKANTEFAVQEKALKAANEQLSTFKSAAEEAAGKLEKSEQRLRAVQNELDCQRHNSEAARKNLEDKFKGSERELNADITQAQNDMMNMERQMRDLQTKLQQQETLARNTQNSLQASLDKALAQTVSVEKDYRMALSRSNQLEAEVAKLEKAAEDFTKNLTQLRQEKEMAAAQVSGLKVKLAAAESSVEKLTTQVQMAEQLADSKKFELEQLYLEKDKVVKDAENSMTKLSQEIGQLQDELKSMIRQRDEAQASVTTTKEDCDRKLAGLNAMEAEVSDMRAKIAKTNAEMELLKTDTVSTVEKAKMEAIMEVEKMKEETRSQVTEAERRAKAAEEEATEAQKREEAARGEKLVAELSAWELEGKIDPLKSEIVQHQEATSALKSEIELLKKEKAEGEKQLETQIKEKEDTIQDLFSALEEKKWSILEIEEKCKDAKVALEALTKKEVLFKSQLEDVQKQHAEHIIALDKNLEKGELALMENNRKIETLSLELGTAQSEKRELLHQLEALRHETEEKLMDLQIALDESNSALEMKQEHVLCLEGKCQSIEQEFSYVLEQKQQIEVAYDASEKQQTEKIANLSQILKKQEDSVQNSQKEVENMTAHVETLMEVNKKLEGENERIKTANEDKFNIVQAALELTENHSSELKKQVEMLQTKVNQLISNFDIKAQGLTEENTKLKQTLADQRLTLDNLNKEHQGKLQRLVEADQEICKLTLNIEEMSVSLKEVTSTLREKENLMKEKGTELANSIIQEKQQEKLVEEVSEQLRVVESHCEILTSSLNEKEEQLSQSNSNSQMLNDDLNTLENKLEAANYEINGLKEDVVKKSQELSQFEMSAECAEEALARVDILEEELKLLQEKHSAVVTELSVSTAVLAAKEEEHSLIQNTVMELENEKNAAIKCLQDKLLLSSEENKGLVQRLQEVEERAEKASKTNYETQIQLDEKSSQLDGFQKQLEQYMSTTSRLKEDLSSHKAEKDQWEAERISWQSAMENMEQANNIHASEIEQLHTNNNSLSERLANLMEAETILQKRFGDMEAVNEQLCSSLVEKNEELQELKLSRELLQEQRQQHDIQVDEAIATLTEKLHNCQKVLQLKESEIEDLKKQHMILCQENEELKSEKEKHKEQLDSAMKSLWTAKERMIDNDTYWDVCAEKEFLRGKAAALQIEYDKVTDKYHQECRKAENVQRDFDSYRDVIMMMGRQQNQTMNGEMAQIQKENVDLIVRLEYLEKHNGQQYRTVCGLRKQVAKLTKQLQAAKEASVTKIHASLQTEELKAPNVIPNIDSQELLITPELKEITRNSQEQLIMPKNEKNSSYCTELPTTPKHSMSYETKTMVLKLKDAESTISSLWHQLEIAAEEMESLRKANQNNSCSGQPEGCVAELVEMKSSEGEQKCEFSDAHSKSTYEKLLEEERTALQKELDSVRDQLMGSQEQLRTLKCLEDQVNTESMEAKERLNQALYDLRRSKDQNKLTCDMVEELEEKVTTLETQLKSVVENRKQLFEENKKLRQSSSMLQEDNKPERETELPSSVIIGLQKDRDNLQEKYNCLREQLDKMLDKQNNIDHEFEESHTKSEELAFLNEELSSKNDELATKNDLLISKNDELTVMIEELKNEVTDLMGQNDVLKSNTETLHKREAELLIENGDLLKAKQELKNQSYNASHRLEEVMSGNKELIARNTEVVLLNETLITENQGLQSLLEKNNLKLVELEKLKANMKELDEDNYNLEKKCNDLEVLMEKNHFENALEKEKERLLDTIKELRDEVTQSHIKCAEFTSQIELLEAERKIKASESDTLSLDKEQILASMGELTLKYNAIATERDKIFNENMGLHSDKENLQLEKDHILNDREELLDVKDKMQSKIEYLEKEKDELQSEKVVLVSQNSELKLEKDFILNDKMQLVSEKEELESKIKEVEKEINGLISENEALVKQEADLHSERNLILNEKLHLMSEKEGLQAEMEQLLKEKNGLLSEKKALEIEKLKLLAEKDDIFSDKLQLLAKNEELQLNNEKALREKESLHSEKEFLLTEKEQLLKNAEDLVLQKSTSDSEQQNLQGEIEVLKVEKEQLTVNVQQYKTMVEQSEMDIDDLHSNIKNLTSLKEKLMSEKDELIKTNEQQLQENGNLVMEVRVLQDKNADISCRNDSLSSQLSQHASDKEQMTSEIDNLKSKSKDMLVEKEQLVKNLGDTKNTLSLVDVKIQTQSKILENQKGEIEMLQKAIQALKQQQCKQEGEVETLKNDLFVKSEEAAKGCDELAKVKGELHVVGENLLVSQANLANKVNETTTLMVEKAALEVEMASLKDRLSSAAGLEVSLARKERMIEKLGILVTESRTDLETLQAKFSLHRKIGRKKEEELRQCLKHIEDLETEANQFKEKVKAAESESNSLCKELREVQQQTDHWQKRFSEKNTEAEEQAAKQIELMKKMLDLEEGNDNMKSKVLLLQGRIKRLKSEKNGKEAPDGRADKELRNQNVKSDASSSSANNPQKEATNSLGLQGSDSQEIVESSLTQVSRNSTVSQITRRAVTRRASTLISVPTAPKESSTKISSKSPKEKSTKPQRSSAVSMDEYSTHNSSQSDRLRTLRTRGRRTSTVTPLGDETMKQAIKRVSSSTSVTKDKKKRQSTITAVPESPGFVETLSTKLKGGLNDLSSGVESPGVLQRSTTLAKKMNPKDMLQESGPLRSLNPNSPVRPSTRRAPTHRTSSVGTRTRASSSTARGDDCKVQ